VIELTEEMVEDARALLGKGNPEAVGYRLMVYVLDVSTGLSMAEMGKFETLGQIGFQKSTNDQAERESSCC